MYALFLLFVLPAVIVTCMTTPPPGTHSYVHLVICHLNLLDNQTFLIPILSTYIQFLCIAYFKYGAFTQVVLFSSYKCHPVANAVHPVSFTGPIPLGMVYWGSKYWKEALAGVECTCTVSTIFSRC